MFQRVLAVTLAQVVRSISVVLLPIAFLSLIAWATAGSTNGNTSDPVRAAIWLWLGAHHLAFNLTISEGAAAGWCANPQIRAASPRRNRQTAGGGGCSSPPFPSSRSEERRVGKECRL